MTKKKDEQYEDKIGILVLIDIVDFTGQAVRLGDEKLKLPLNRVETYLKSICSKPETHYVKSIGDAFLVFIEGIDILRVQYFLDLLSQLRNKSLEGYFDVEDFIIGIRSVAHPGIFQFKTKDNRIMDMQSAEGIIPFRIEKEAGRYEVVITSELLNLIKNILVKKNIEFVPIGKVKIKGFKDKSPFLYKLRFPWKIEPSELLDIKMAGLEKACQIIPLFGGAFNSIGMSKNFINLSIKGKPKDRFMETEKKAWILETIEASDRIKKAGTILEHYGLILNVEKLYETYNQGIIFGLPGSGKTTILRYFAYKNFLELKPINGGKRLTLFFYCRTSLPYKQWLKSSKIKQKSDLEDIKTILTYFTHHFLFGKKRQLTEKEKKEFYKAGQEVIRAYKENRLTLLLDALDESESGEMKESIVSLYRLLSGDFGKGNNKIFLTTRVADKEAFFNNDDEQTFEVCSLDMEQLREMARHFYEDEPGLYRKFDEAVWKDQIAARVGGTPLTASLLLAYFKIFLRLESRYKMYDVLVKFILLDIWEKVKETDVKEGLIKKFFEDAAAATAHQNPDLYVCYDALTLLAYDYIRIEGSTMTRTSILNTFSQVTKREDAGELFDELVKEHLLLFVGRSRADDEYIFIHSTIMEYLAARFIVNCLENLPTAYQKESFKLEQPLFDLETIPIAAGSSMDNGFKIMELLRKVIPAPQDEELEQAVHVCAYKSLPELEQEIENEMEKARTPRLKNIVLEQIKEHREKVEWIYRRLAEYILSRGEIQLKKNLHIFTNISKLCLPDFLENYLSFPSFSDGEAAIVSLRKALLSKIIDEGILNDWLLRNERIEVEHSLKKEEAQLEKAGGSLLRFDSGDYNPEDKNFNYYKEYTRHLLTGILGSPNLRHSGPVNCIAILSGGKFIVSGSNDKTLKLWELSTGKETRIFKGHEKPVTAVSVFPEGRRMVSGSKDKTLKLWDISSGTEIRTFYGHEDSITGVIALPGDEFIISSSDDETLKLWEISTGREIRTFVGHAHYVNCASIVPGNKYLVSGASDRTLKVWDISNGREILCYEGHEDYVTCVSVSPDGKSVLSGSSDGILQEWDLATGKNILAMKNHDDVVTAVSFLPDGKHAISASFDNSVKLWDLSAGKEVREFQGHGGQVNCAAVTPGGEYIAAGVENSFLEIWPLDTGAAVRSFKGNADHVNCAAVSPDNKYIITGSHEHSLKLWDIPAGRETRLFKGHNNHVSCAGISPNGKYLISGSYDHTLKSWEISTGKEIRSFSGHTDRIACLVITPNGKHVISGSEDHTLKLWDLFTGEEEREFRGHNAAVTSISVTLDGEHFISASSDKTLKLWNLHHGYEIRTFKNHSDHVTGVSVMADGKHFVSGSSDGTLTLWFIQDEVPVRPFTGHRDGVTSLCITPDGKFLISGSHDMTIRIWYVEHGDCINEIALPWVPLSIVPIPGEPSHVFISNCNSNISLFNLSKIF